MEMESNLSDIRFDGKEVIRLTKWKVRIGSRIGQMSHLLFNYRNCNENLEPIGDELRFKCKKVGVIIDKLVKKEGDIVLPNDIILEYKNCLHNTIMKDLCADCGANINSLDANARQRIVELTSVSMIHSVPELRVSKERAETLGRADELRLLKDRKLVLLVDLDQTIIHSTNHSVPRDMSGVHHFQLYGPQTHWYHTKFRPHTIQFLKSISKLFELHICTFGARRYAHEIANLIDPKELYFPKDRILSRDECFDPTSKTGNMKSLFPCGDAMVCIIDDREDVWNFAPNLVTVKPYICFRDTGDINAPEKPVSQLFINDMIPNSDKTFTFKESPKIDKNNTIKDKIQHQISPEQIAKTEKVIEENTSITHEVNGNNVKNDELIVEKVMKSDEIIDSTINERIESLNDKKVEKTEETVEKSEEKVEKTEETVEKSEEKVEKTEETVEKSEEKVEKTEETVEKSEEKVEKTEEKTEEKPEEKTEKTEEIVEKFEEKVENIEEIIEKTEVIVEKSEEKIEKMEEIVEKLEEKVEKTEEKNEEISAPNETNKVFIEKMDETTDTSFNISKEEKVISDPNYDSSPNIDINVELTEKSIKEDLNTEKIELNEENVEQKPLNEDNDDYLLYLEEILTRIHKDYYSEYDEKIKYKSEGEEIKIPDLKEIIPNVRKCVLRGVNIVFSGVIPTNIPPEKNKLYNIAKSFGAKVTTDIVVNGSPKTTHLIAAKWGTVKVNKCIKLRNVFIVNPMWLYSCAERWERVDERLYPLDKEDFSGDKERLLIKQTPESSVKNQFVNQLSSNTAVVSSCPVYDPKTGKRIRVETQNTFLGLKTETQPKSEAKDPIHNTSVEMLEKSRQIQPHNMLDFSPLSVFTKNELQSMGKEVDDACSEGDAMSTGNTDSESDIDIEEVKVDKKTHKKRECDSSSDENIDDDCPKGWTKNKKHKRSVENLFNLEEENDSTIDSYDFEKMREIGGEDSTDEESIGSVDEEMALAVEREFLN